MNRIPLFGLALALLAAAPARAELKVGVVDIQRIIETSESGKSAKETLKSAYEERQKALEGQRKSIQDLQAELEQQGVLLSPDAKKKKEEDLEGKKKEFMESLHKSEVELQAKDAELTRGVLRELEGIISELGKAEGYDLILERGETTVVFMAEALDLTDRIIARFNESAKKPKVPEGQVRE